MPQKLSTVFTLLILWSASLLAQENLLFRHIDTKGYSILTFYKDANRVMWLGTNSGLVSFPQLMSRTPNAYDRGHQELNSSIYLMSGDEDGKLWMKNINRDVVMYNPIHNSIESNTSQLLSQMGVNVWKEYNILVEKSGKGWVWKGDKLYCISSMKENKVWKEMSFNGLLQKLTLSLLKSRSPRSTSNSSLKPLQ